MKDLFVLTADSDAQALMTSVLRRHRELQIQPITFKVQRFAGRDSGMVKVGPEIARDLAQKTEYSRLILMWDHHGSGWNARTPENATHTIQGRLDGVTWADRSAAVVIVPELEEWLWHCPASIARCIGSNATEFDRLVERAVKKLDLSIERCRLRSRKSYSSRFSTINRGINPYQKRSRCWAHPPV
jgi:hypothetical protein